MKDIQGIKYSDMVKDIYYRYTGNIEPFGIDECWLDISAYKKIGSGAKNINGQNDIVYSPRFKLLCTQSCL